MNHSILPNKRLSFVLLSSGFGFRQHGLLPAGVFADVSSSVSGPGDPGPGLSGPAMSGLGSGLGLGPGNGPTDAGGVATNVLGSGRLAYQTIVVVHCC